MHRMFCVLSFVSFVSFVVAAQQTPNTPPAQGAPTFRTTTRLIVQTVSVTDRDGKPVEGLTAKDFVVTEDGEPQEISFVEFQRIESTAEGVRPEQPAVSQPTPAAAQPASAAATLQPTAPSQISTSQPGDIRYRNRRLVVLYFDLSAMPPPDLIRAYSSALRYIDTQMQPQDLLAIMTFQGGAVRGKQDFTDNRAALREVITTLIYGNDLDGDGIPDRPEDTASAFGQDDAEFNIFNTDRQLSAL